MIFVQEYTIYFLQGFELFVSFKAFGPSRNKQLESLQKMNLYIPSRKLVVFPVCSLFYRFVLNVFNNVHVLQVSRRFRT